MVARNKIHLNPKGIDEILSSASMRRAVQEAAEKVAENVRSQGIKVGGEDGDPSERDLPVSVHADATGPAESRVTLAHPAGLAVQAKHGALTKAARQAGLDVTEHHS